jgi:hypothetical protein
LLQIAGLVQQTKRTERSMTQDLLLAGSTGTIAHIAKQHIFRLLDLPNPHDSQFPLMPIRSLGTFQVMTWLFKPHGIVGKMTPVSGTRKYCPRDI